MHASLTIVIMMMTIMTMIMTMIIMVMMMMMMMTTLMTGDNKVLRAQRVRRQMMESVASRWAAKLFEQCNHFPIQCNANFSLSIQCNTSICNVTLFCNATLFQQRNVLQHNAIQCDAMQICLSDALQCYPAIQCNSLSNGT